MQFLTLLLLLSLPNTVFAYGDSLFVGGSKTYTNGTYQTVQGAQARITLPGSFPSVTSGQMSTAYVAVTNGTAIAQVGFAFEPSVSSVNPHHYLGNRPIGGTYSEVRLLSGPSTSTGVTYLLQKESGYWKGYHNGTLVGSTNANVAPVSVQYFNETYDDAEKWIGTSNSSSSTRLQFSSVKYWDGSLSGSDISKWVWRIPALNFIDDGDADIDSSNYGTGAYWTSWRGGGV